MSVWYILRKYVFSSDMYIYFNINEFIVGTQYIYEINHLYNWSAINLILLAD